MDGNTEGSSKINASGTALNVLGSQSQLVITAKNNTYFQSVGLGTAGNGYFGGNVGIGVINPSEKLSIGGNLFLTGSRSEIYGTDRNHMIVLRGRQDGTPLDEINYYEYGAHVFSTGGIAASQTEKMRISANGNVGIGTSTPTEKLSVNGNIRSKKIIVTQTGWSDYVFDSSYQLKPLTEVERFIKTHKHLPEVPSSKEVEKGGIDVGDNQALLLKKIEELTLYMIEMKKNQEVLEMKNDIQQKENSLLKQRIEKLENKM